MSTTDPNSGTPQPGAGPQWPADVSHLGAPDDHGGGGGVNPQAVRAGHEPGAFAVRPIMSIPLAVVVAFVIAFTVAAGVFAYFMGSIRDNPLAHPEAISRGDAPLNERLERIDREGMHDSEAKKSKFREVDQPRLEPLKRRANNGQVTTQPELPSGNSPEIHPEEIHPTRVPALHQAGYVGNDKKFARIPIDDAMKIAVANKEILPVRKEPSNPLKSYQKPTAASAGRGVLPPPPKVEAKKEAAPAPKKNDTNEQPKKEEPKKEQPKKDEPKKDGKAPEPKQTPEKKS